MLTIVYERNTAEEPVWLSVICMPHSVPVAPVNTSVLSMRTSDLTHSILSNLSDLEVLDLLMSVMLLSICIVVGFYSKFIAAYSLSQPCSLCCSVIHYPLP